MGYRVLTAVFAALTLAMAAPASAALSNAQINAAVDKAATALAAKDPAGAIAALDPVIAESPGTTPIADTTYLCATGPEDTLSTLIGATVSNKKGTTVAIDGAICDALFLKGFALIDMDRAAEAEPFLRRATELAPTNAHYLNEYAEWHKTAHNLDVSYSLFAKAAALGPQQPEDSRAVRTARALRGMGFILIERGKLDEAETKLNEALALEPASKATLNELAYIKEQRAKSQK